MSLWRLQADSYKGLPIRAACQVHQCAADLLTKHVEPLSGVLDLAAGSGAWLSRLSDLGFDELHAVELAVDHFELPHPVPRALDLNTDFSREFDRTFKLISATEIIEHLNSPRHFIGQIANLLDNDGYLLVTTPNTAHWAGRIRFLLSGEQRYFRESDYHHQRHISPVSDLHMRLMLRELGFRVVDIARAGTFFGPLKKLVFAPLSLAFAAALGPSTMGDVTIYLAQRTNEECSSPGRTSHYFPGKSL